MNRLDPAVRFAARRAAEPLADLCLRTLPSGTQGRLPGARLQAMRVLYLIRFVIREGLLGLWRNRHRTVLRTTVSAVALALFGMMLAVHLNLGHIAGEIENQVEVEIYLRDDITASQVDALVQQIAQMPGVASSRYISKRDALAIAREMFRDSPALLATLTEEQNPLPASFVLTLETPQLVRQVAEQLRQAPGVEHVRYGQEDVDRLLSLTASMRVAGIGMTIFLAAVVVVFMSSIIEAVVDSYTAEIRTMYNMGASLLQVLSLFLVQGLVLGLLSGALATAGTLWMYGTLHEAVRRDLAFLPMLPPEAIRAEVLRWLLIAGVVVGLVTSGVSAYRRIQVPRSYRQLRRAQLRRAAAAKAR